MRSTALVLVVLMCGTSSGAAQTASLNDMLTAARLPISVRDGRLEGAGADVLRTAMAATPYVLIGEDHGLAEVPLFSAPVFRDMAARGVRDLVVEVGPEAGRRLTRLLDSADPLAETSAWMRRYPFSVAFYNLDQELTFRRAARTAAGPGLRTIATLVGSGDDGVPVIRPWPSHPRAHFPLGTEQVEGDVHVHPLDLAPWRTGQA